MHPNANTPNRTPNHPAAVARVPVEPAPTPQPEPAPAAEGSHRRSKGRASHPAAQPEAETGA